MKTRIIYLNEEDRPQPQKPMEFAEWMNQGHSFWKTLSDNYLSIGAKEWLEYRNNFKSHDQPIEFTERWDDDRRVWFSKHLNHEPKDFKLIVVSKNDYGTFFDCYLKNDCNPLRFKGDLNSGTV